MSLRANRAEWQHLAGDDPMWAIASLPGREGAWTEAEFFATGESQIGAMLAGLERLGVAVRTGRALDFGCGLGRLSRALGERFDAVTGVDISPGMVERARTLNAYRPACRFVVNDHPDLRDLHSDTFDLIVSMVTLQHVPNPDVIRDYIREFARVAAPGGVIVFQLPSHVGWRVRLKPRTLLARVAWRVPRLPGAIRRFLGSGSLTLHALPEREVRELLRGAGAEVLEAFPDDSVGSDQVPTLCYIAIRS